MKKLAVCAVVTLISLGGYAQSKDFEKLSKIKDVEFVHIDKNMIRLAAANGEPLSVGENIFVGKGNDDFIQKIDDIMVFSCEKAAAIEKLKKSAQKLLKGNKWQSLIDMKNDDGETVKICQAKEGDQITNVVLAIEDDEAQLVIIKGALDIAQLLKHQAEQQQQ